MDITVGLIMDVILLLFLAVMIFYAVRLSQSLNAFKRNKTEFEQLIMTLSGHIEQAHSSIDALKSASGQSAEHLQELISEARYMNDELRQVNEASDSLAYRLEKLAQQGRQSVAPLDGLSDGVAAEAPVEAEVEADNVVPVAQARAKSGQRKAVKQAAGEKKTSPAPWQNSLGVKMQASSEASAQSGDAFAIRDMDYEASSHEVSSEEGEQFSSQAERDLYEALKGRRS